MAAQRVGCLQMLSIRRLFKFSRHHRSILYALYMCSQSLLQASVACILLTVTAEYLPRKILQQ